MKRTVDIEVLTSLEMDNAVSAVQELQKQIETKLTEIAPLLHTGGRLFTVNLDAMPSGYASAGIALSLFLSSLDPFVAQSVVGQRGKERLISIARRLGVDSSDIKPLSNYERILEILDN